MHWPVPTTKARQHVLWFSTYQTLPHWINVTTTSAKPFNKMFLKSASFCWGISQISLMKIMTVGNNWRQNTKSIINSVLPKKGPRLLTFLIIWELIWSSNLALGRRNNHKNFSLMWILRKVEKIAAEGDWVNNDIVDLI